VPDKSRLGRGIDAILDSLDEGQVQEPGGHIVYLAPAEVAPNPFQPRKDFDSDKARETLDDLKASIEAKGLVQPITVRLVEDGYQVIAGERRLRACKELGMESIPAYILQVREDVDMMELALIENLQRDNLNPLEEAEAYSLLSGKYDLSHEDIAKNIGKSRVTITNSLRLLKLPPEIKTAIKTLQISAGHARAILGIETSKEQIHAFHHIQRAHLSVRETEKYINKIKKKTVGSRPKRKASTKSLYIRKVEEELMTLLGTRVVIKPGRKKGIIEVEYYSQEDLERLVELLSELAD